MENKKYPPIYVVSGGKGLAGDHLVHTLLVQYPENNVPVIVVPNVHTEEEVDEIVKKACEANGIITHTMVNKKMRNYLMEKAIKCKVKTIDFMYELSEYLDNLLDVCPLGRPGLYRIENKEYFDRIEAIEFTLGSDDGINPQKLKKAEIVLTGVSRAGKTPLSVYLAMFGWKVANIPLVDGIEPPKELFQVDYRRVFGLTISPLQLKSHRRKRLSSMGIHRADKYIEPLAIDKELQHANNIFKRGRFTVINVSNKPIETTATEIIHMMSDRFNTYDRKTPVSFPK